MNWKGIQAVIFDMDGLMLDSQSIATLAWKAAVHEQGFVLTDDVNLSLVGRAGPDADAILTRTFGSEFCVRDCRVRALDLYVQSIEKNGLPLKPGLIELLDWLETVGVPKAVATSTPSVLAHHKLAITGIEHYFDAILTSDDVEHGKPEPDIFVAAAEALAAIPQVLPRIGRLVRRHPGRQSGSHAMCDGAGPATTDWRDIRLGGCHRGNTGRCDKPSPKTHWSCTLIVRDIRICAPSR